MARQRFSGYTRWDDATSEPDTAEPDVDLLPYDETDQAYLERRRQAQLAHYRERLAIDERRHDHAAAALWRRLLAELQTGDDWASGEGDRRLF